MMPSQSSQHSQKESININYQMREGKDQLVVIRNITVKTREKWHWCVCGWVSEWNKLTAVRAASEPLLPDLPPARLRACSIVSQVSTPKMHGTPTDRTHTNTHKQTHYILICLAYSQPKIQTTHQSQTWIYPCRKHSRRRRISHRIIVGCIPSYLLVRYQISVQPNPQTMTTTTRT